LSVKLLDPHAELVEGALERQLELHVPPQNVLLRQALHHVVELEMEARVRTDSLLSGSPFEFFEDRVAQKSNFAVPRVSEHDLQVADATLFKLMQLDAAGGLFARWRSAERAEDAAHYDLAGSS